MRRKALDSVGGAAYLCEMGDNASLSVYGCEHYIAILQDRAKLRQGIYAAAAAQVEGMDGSITGDELLSRMAQRIAEIEASTAEPETTITDDVLAAMYEIEMESRSSRELLGATLCLPQVDESVMGVRRGELLIIGGMPERAKTAFALQIGRANARRGDWVDFHSLEMGKNQVTRRNLATMAGVYPSKVRDPRQLTAEEKRKLQDAAAALARLPFQIHKHKGLTPAKLFSKMRLSVQRHKQALADAGKLHIIIIDHLKALSFCCPGQDERHRMNHAIEMLRRFADDEQVVVIVLHHLNRPQSNINELPTVLRLKESGDIEAAANIILALHREEAEDGTFTGKDFILILKMREGEKGPIPAELDKFQLEYKPRTWQ
jgi:replicative DNA helicase